MNKPTVPADLMPSALLSYATYNLPLDVRTLIQHCDEVRQQADWQQIDAIAVDVDRLTLLRGDKCEQAIAWVYLADLCWAAERLEQARRFYKDAQEAFTLSSDIRHRHNEAAAAYGRGLVDHAMGHGQEAQLLYNQSLRLLQRSIAHWGYEGNAQRCQQCGEAVEQIERLEKLCMDSPLLSARAGSASTLSMPAERAPVLLAGIPANGADDVPIDAPIVLTFSKPMQAASFHYTIEPQDRLGLLVPPVWWENNTIALIQFPRGTFDYGTTYHVEIIDARDRDGYLLTDGCSPRHWSFRTQNAPGVGPEVVSFVGSNTSLPPNAPIVVIFNRPVDPSTLRLDVNPDPGGLSPAWDLSQTVAVIEHNPFRSSPIEVEVEDIRDTLGNSLADPVKQQLNFTSSVAPAGAPPQILAQWPPANQTDICVDIPLVILFDKPMGMVQVHTNPALAHRQEMLHPACKSVFILHHANLCIARSYSVQVMGEDERGRALDPNVSPLGWNFTTQSSSTSSRILGAAPLDGATDVPLAVKPLVVFTRSMSADPADFAWAPKDNSCRASWSADSLHRVAVIHPSPGLMGSEQRYVWSISRACDDTGANVVPAGVPFSWSFTTERKAPPPPTIIGVKPDRSLRQVAVDQKIEITFSDPMDPGRFAYEILPKPGDQIVEWDIPHQVATIEHSIFKHSETYTVVIRQAYARNGLPLIDRSGPISWSFTTRAADPIIRCTYPSHNDVEVALDTFVLVAFDQPMQHSGVELNLSSSGVSRLLSPNRWTSDRTAAIVALPRLAPMSEYEVEVLNAQNTRGQRLSANRFTSVPNPWRFRTMGASLTQSQTLQDLSLLVVAVSVLTFVFGIALALYLWQGWLPLGAYVAALALTTVVAFNRLRRSRLLFSIAEDEEAVIRTPGQLRLMPGRQPTVWRIPFFRELRALFSTRPITFLVPDCKVTDEQGKEITLAVEIRYRIFNSLKAYRFLVQSAIKGDNPTGIYGMEDLQRAWQKEIRQAVATELSGSLAGLSVGDIERSKEEVEENFTKALIPKTCCCGIELQYLRIAKVG
jgi:hypothetical protein